MDLTKILKNAPDGVELYSPLCGPCELNRVTKKTITVTSKRNKGFSFMFDEQGKKDEVSDCLLWPSAECNNWDNWQHVLFKEEHTIVHNNTICKIISIDEETTKLLFSDNTTDTFSTAHMQRARWADEKESTNYCIILGENFINETHEKDMKITEQTEGRVGLQPFDKVLARDLDHDCWHATVFSHIDKKRSQIYTYRVAGGWYYQCIPYNDETKHLLGTTDEAPEKYITWEKTE